MTRRLLAMAVLVIVAATDPTSADTYTVDIGGTGDYTEIQPALTAAVTGDTVRVLPGTYIGDNNTNLNFDGKGIALIGEGGARSVTIDGQGSRYGFWFAHNEGPNAIVEGFTVVNGYEGSGGAVYCDSGTSPSFIDCTFSNCVAEYGGAVYIWSGSPSFTNCVFSGNQAEGDGYGACVYCEHSSSVFADCTFSDNSSVHLGGAVYCYDSGLSFTGCDFSGNSAPTGGGVMCTSDEPTPVPGRRTSSTGENSVDEPDGNRPRRDRVAPSFTDCTFSGNSGRFGGVFYCKAGSSPALTRCSFSDNLAFGGGSGAGGVMYSEHSSPTFVDCMMSGNSSNYGGAVYNWNGSPSFSGCTFSDNSALGTNGDGGALYFDNAAASVMSCTFSDNWSDRWGGSVHCWFSDPVLTNCIIAFGTAGPSVYCEDGTENPVLTCCNVFGNAGGDWVGCIADQSGTGGNVSADPLFCDRPGGDFTIDAGSPCAAANSGGCGLVGALDVGCDSPVKAASWGGIKALYR